MYSAKSVGPRIDPWGTPALTGYSCDHFPCRTSRGYLLLRKEEIRPNIWPKIWYDLSFWSRPAYQTLPKALDISSATGHVTPDLLEVLAILSDTTVRTFSGDRENLKPCLKSEKAHISLGNQQSYIYKFFKDFTNHRKKTYRSAVFSCIPFPNILKYSDHQWNIATIWKIRLLQALIEEFN